MNDLVKSTTIEMLADNALGTLFENFDDETLTNAKNRIIDTIGCIIGGANDTGNPQLIDLLREWGSKGEATVFVHGFKGPAHNVAMANSIMARSFDFEPVGPLVDGITLPGHISGSTIPAAIAMGEVVGAGGKELITALLVGDDIAARILLAGTDPEFIFQPGWDDIGTLSPFGTAAISGRLLGLNGRQMRNAFGIAVNHLGGSLQMIRDATTAFKLTQGVAARNGIFAAQLAKVGWTGPEDALFSKYGYFYLYTEGCRNSQALTKDLGKKYFSDNTIKPYPCCRTTHAAVDCALALVHKHDIDPRDIEEVTLYVARRSLDGVCGRPFKIGDFPHANAIWSYQYTVATALCRKSLKPEYFTEKAIRDSDIYTILDRIKLAELPGAGAYRADLKAVMKDGREFSESCQVAKGDQLENPMSKDEIISKFWTNIEFSGKVSGKNAEKLLDLLENLEELDNIQKIIQPLVP